MKGPTELDRIAVCRRISIAGLDDERAAGRVADTLDELIDAQGANLGPGWVNEGHTVTAIGADMLLITLIGSGNIEWDILPDTAAVNGGPDPHEGMLPIVPARKVGRVEGAAALRN